MTAQTDPPSTPPSIVLVSCWMGPLPPYLTLFLGSCRANPSVSFLIPSDQPAPPDLPPNVRWMPLTLDGFSTLASERLGVPVRVARGYKLCDFKPTLGRVFADAIGDADFWGFCDIDLFWGDLRAFLTDEFLADGDLFSFRGPMWISGALGIARTQSAATRLFAQIPGWPEILADDHIRGFDECAFRFDGVTRSVADLVAAGETVSLTDVAREADAAGTLRLRFLDDLPEPSRHWAPYQFRWHRGTLTDHSDGVERIACHFVRAKSEPFFTVDRWDPLPDDFYVTPTGTTTIPPSARVRRLVRGTGRVTWGLPAAVRYYTARGAHWLRSRRSRHA